ncbi:MAG TPA: hypothetical protein PLF81_28660 [Candidatus Anammoximicrobium sp.]|nr:hypothetical protein [Candidatus Anammoximicrobium sp.]
MPLAILLAAALLIFLTPSAQAEPLMLCGDDTVFVVDTARDKIEKVWTWKAIECAQLPEAMRGTFATTDDCKPRVSAHGVVWDEGRQLLWALGLNELRSYGLRDWDSDKPSLALSGSYPLPDADGHDLQPVPRGHDLVVTTGRGVYLFDRDKHGFRLHPDLGQKAHVKSVSVHPVTGRMAFIQASDKAWWTDSRGLLSPADTIQLPGERLYKARWLISAGAR